jgi:hypothetical protein
VAELEAEIAGLEASLASLRTEAAGWEDTKASYEERIDEISRAAAAIADEKAGLEALLEEERRGRKADAESAESLQDDLFAAIATAEDEAASLQSRLGDLELELELARLEAASAGTEADAARLAAAEAATARAAWELEGGIDESRFPILLVDGFSEAKARIGTWKLDAATAAQTDPSQFFARLDIPLAQGEGRAYLYRFTARSTGGGWVGLGIHFFASAVKSRKGYGEGKSLLVWLTRDQAVRKTGATWLQLYRSLDDVNMERVFDARLEEAIREEHAVEIVYDPKTGYLVAALDGRIAAVYRTFFGIEEGLGISLRSLGAGAEFGDFEVRATEAP